MKWYTNLYVGQGLSETRKKVINNIRNRKFQPDIYVITTATAEGNLLDIYPAYILLQKHFIKEKIVVLGIAKGKDEAMDIMQTIIMDIYNKTDGFAIKQFLKG